MIVLFTSNSGSGIFQFTMQMVMELDKIGQEVLCFIPDDSEKLIMEYCSKFIYYKKDKKLCLYNKYLNDLTKKIESYNPDYVLFTDSNTLSSQLCVRLSTRTKTICTIHDVKDHPLYSSGLIDAIRDRVRFFYRDLSNYKCNSILLLSQESKNKYVKSYPRNSKKIKVMPLGAHVLDFVSQMPPELKDIKEYYLFFGNIQKYKGLSTLLKAYKYMDQSLKLVIFGYGKLTDEEKNLTKQKGIVLINRSATNEEMIYLFENARVSILPYIEASQSGIIPISYKYGVPVLTSNVEGLAQFVEHGKTGFVCQNEQDYGKYSIELLKDPSFKNNCKFYYKTNLDWNKNLRVLMKELNLND